MFEEKLIFKTSQCDPEMEDLVMSVRSSDYELARDVFLFLDSYLDPSVLFDVQSTEEVEQKTIDHAKWAIGSASVILYKKDKYEDICSILETGEGENVYPLKSLLEYGMVTVCKDYPFVSGEEKKVIAQSQDYFKALFTLETLWMLERKRNDPDLTYLSSLENHFSAFSESHNHILGDFLGIMYASLNDPPDDLKN